MTETATAEVDERPPFDLTRMGFMIGRRVSAVLLKRVKPEGRHPENRMFLAFDDGTGYEFFASGPIIPWIQHRFEDYPHVVRQSADEFQTVYRDVRDELVDAGGELPKRSRKRAARSEAHFDKSRVEVIVGERIAGVHVQSSKKKAFRLFLVLGAGGVMEFQVVGQLCACGKLEPFDLFRLLNRGRNAYENEVLVVADPDGKGREIVINELYRWPR